MSPRRPKAPLDDEDAATEIYDSAPRATPMSDLAAEMTEMDNPPVRPTMPLRPAGRATPNPTEGPSVQRPRTSPKSPTAPPPMPRPPALPPAQAQAAPLPPAPLKSVSMKTPAEIAAERKATRAAQPQRPQIPQVQIRSIGDVHRRAQTSTPAHGMGTIAPPRDPKQAREREIWSLVFWGSIVVIIASLVALVVWLIAR